MTSTKFTNLIEAATETSCCSIEGPGSVDNDTVTGEVAVGSNRRSAIGNIATDASSRSFLVALILSALASASLLFFHFFSPSIVDAVNTVKSSRNCRQFRIILAHALTATCTRIARNW